MQVTLGECLKLTKDYERELQRFVFTRKDVAFVYHDKDEEPEPPAESVGQITEKMTELWRKIRFLRREIARKNLEVRLNFPADKEEKITMAEGIVLLGQLLQERENIQMFLGQPATKREVILRTQVEYRTATYNADAIKKYASGIDKDIRLLRIEIDRANVNTFVDIPENILTL